MAWMLSCIGCGTKKLPDKEEIEILDFQHFSLTAVPPYVFECERFLEELYLDCNQITELPKELFLCQGLRILSVSDNDLHSIPPAISSLTNLTSLDISRNGISDIPDSIKGCKRLRVVNASTNPLCRLPEGFTQLVALKELSLSDTFLEYLPANFGRLSGLEVLELRENQLNTLPRSMTRLIALRRLDLGQNEFTELPEVVGHLTNLTDLWVDRNRVKRISAEIGRLSRLSFLDASKNRINEVDEQIGHCSALTDLYLTANEIEELPNSLCRCVRLVSLHVDDNQLEQLPDDLGALERLVELKAPQNELSHLPPSVGLLRSLQFLHVDDNALTSLPGELGSCSGLRVLTATRNRIEVLPAEMGSLSSLRVLNLCGNFISSLPVSFSKLQLAALWLSENQAKPHVPLQCVNDAIGQKVLTCFMLPQRLAQTPAPSDHAKDDDRPLTEAEIEARRARSLIHFAADGDPKSPRGLTRVPTPYPKELRALAKHTRNILALRKEREKEPSTVEDEAPKQDDPLMKNAGHENSSSLITLKTSSASVKVASTVASESAIKPASNATLAPQQPGSLRASSESGRPLASPQSAPLISSKVATGPPSDLGVPLGPTVPGSATVESTTKDLAPQILDFKDSALQSIPTHCSPEGVRLPIPVPSLSSPITLEELPVKPLEDLPEEAPPPLVNLVGRDLENTVEIQTKLKDVPVVSLATSTQPLPSSYASPPLAVSMATNFSSSSHRTLADSRPASIAVTDFPLGHGGPTFRCSYPMRPGSLALDGTVPPWQKQRPGSLAAPINTVGIPPASEAKRCASHSALHRPPGGGEDQTFSVSPLQSVASPGGWVLAAHSSSVLGDTPGSFRADARAPSSVGVAATGTRNGPYPTPGLVSIINRVTEESSEEGVQSSPLDHSFDTSLESPIEKPVSRIPLPKGPLASNLDEVGKPDTTQTHTSTGYAPRLSFATQAPQGPPRATPPRLATPEVGGSRGVSKLPSSIPSPQGILGHPSSLSVTSPSGVSLAQPCAIGVPVTKAAKSNIPTLASPPALGALRSPTGTSSLRFEWPKVPPVDTKETTSPLKGGGPPPSRIPGAPRTPSQTERESCIPVKRTSGTPVTLQGSPPVSPLEKPINQTGLPPLKSPTESLEKVGSRIPTFSNSSLRAKTPPKEVRHSNPANKTVNSSS